MEEIGEVGVEVAVSYEFVGEHALVFGSGVAVVVFVVLQSVGGVVVVVGVAGGEWVWLYSYPDTRLVAHIESVMGAVDPVSLPHDDLT